MTPQGKLILWLLTIIYLTILILALIREFTLCKEFKGKVINGTLLIGGVISLVYVLNN